MKLLSLYQIIIYTITTIFLFLSNNKSYAQFERRNEYRVGLEVGQLYLYSIINFDSPNPINYTAFEFSLESKQLRNTHTYLTFNYLYGNGSRPRSDKNNMTNFNLHNHYFNPGIGVIIWKGIAVHASFLYGRIKSSRKYVLEGKYFEDKEVEYTYNIKYNGFKIEARYYTPLFLKHLRAFLTIGYQYSKMKSMDDDEYELKHYVPGAKKEVYAEVTEPSFNNGSFSVRLFLVATLFKKE